MGIYCDDSIRNIADYASVRPGFGLPPLAGSLLYFGTWYFNVCVATAAIKEGQNLCPLTNVELLCGVPMDRSFLDSDYSRTWIVEPSISLAFATLTGY